MDCVKWRLNIKTNKNLDTGYSYVKIYVHMDKLESNNSEIKNFLFWDGGYGELWANCLFSPKFHLMYCFL